MFRRGGSEDVQLRIADDQLLGSQSSAEVIEEFQSPKSELAPEQLVAGVVAAYLPNTLDVLVDELPGMREVGGNSGGLGKRKYLVEHLNSYPTPEPRRPSQTAEHAAEPSGFVIYPSLQPCIWAVCDSLFGTGAQRLVLPRPAPNRSATNRTT